MRAHALDGDVEHVAGQLGHHHIANDDVEFILHHGANALGPVGHGHDFVKIGLEKLLDDALEHLVIFQEQDALGLDHGSGVLDVDAVRSGWHLLGRERERDLSRPLKSTACATDRKGAA